MARVTITSSPARCALLVVATLLLAVAARAQEVDGGVQEPKNLIPALELDPDIFITVKTTTKAPVFTLPPFVTLTIKPPPTTTKPPTTTVAPTTTTAAPTTTTAAPTTTTNPPTTTTTDAPATTTTAAATPSPTTTTPSVTGSPPTAAPPVTPPPTTPPTGSPATPPATPDSTPVPQPPTTTSNDEVITSAPTDLTEPPAQTSVPTSALDLRAAFQISGTQWGLLLSNETSKMNLESAVIIDISELLLVPTSDVVLLGVYEGSLIVSFAIFARPGRGGQALLTRFQANVGSTGWLKRTLAEYRQISPESSSILRTGVTFVNSPASSPMSSSETAWRPVAVVVGVVMTMVAVSMGF